MLKLIACVDKNFGIGKDNKLPWTIKEEMELFKKTTTGHTIVMGRKTYESIGRLLPNRKNIILSNQKKYIVDGAITNYNFNQIIQLSKTEDVFIIGGSKVYKLFENYYDELYISFLNDDYKCDTFLNINLNNFEFSHSVEYKEFHFKKYVSRKNIMYGTVCANSLKQEMATIRNDLVNKSGIKPSLVIIQVGQNYASDVYIRNKIKLATELNITVVHIHLLETNESKLLELIDKLNKDKSVHGILVQMPLPNNISEDKVINAISPIKDVDCFNPYNVGKLWTNANKMDLIIPCTPHGVIKLLEYNNVNLDSKNVVIIGRSNIVSKPLAALMIAKNATVQICHSKTNDLKEKTLKADVVVVAIGRSKFIDASYIKEGAIIVDVGINRDENGMICGDVNFNDCIHKAKLITPVPYGIGPMTLIMLFYNLLLCYKKQVFNHI